MANGSGPVIPVSTEDLRAKRRARFFSILHIKIPKTKKQRAALNSLIRKLGGDK